MNSIVVLSLLLALWCGLSMAKDDNDAVVYKLDESSIQAAAAYYASPRALKRTAGGQGRLIGHNWSLGQIPFKNYLFTKSESHDKDRDYDPDTDSEEYPDEDHETDPEHIPPPPAMFPGMPLHGYAAYGAYSGFPSPYAYGAYGGYPSPYTDFAYQGYPYQSTKYYNRYYYEAPRKVGKSAGKNCRQSPTRGKSC